MDKERQHSAHPRRSSCSPTWIILSLVSEPNGGTDLTQFSVALYKLTKTFSSDMSYDDGQKDLLRETKFWNKNIIVPVLILQSISHRL